MECAVILDARNATQLLDRPMKSHAFEPRFRIEQVQPSIVTLLHRSGALCQALLKYAGGEEGVTIPLESEVEYKRRDHERRQPSTRHCTITRDRGREGIEKGKMEYEKTKVNSLGRLAKRGMTILSFLSTSLTLHTRIPSAHFQADVYQVHTISPPSTPS
jgi:hypothetical protein